MSSFMPYPPSGQMPSPYMSSFGQYGSGIPDTGAFVNIPGATSFSSFQTAYPNQAPVGFNADSMAGYTPPPAAGSGGMFSGLGDKISSMFPSGMMGSTDTKTGIKTDGWGGLALGVGKGLMDGYMGMQMYGLAKDTLESNKAQHAQNFAAQKTTTNNAIGDVYDGRSGSTAAGKKDYMTAHGVA